MLYQPETFKDCLEIECKKCIMTNINICLQTLKKSEFVLLKADLRENIIINYASNVLFREV